MQNQELSEFAWILLFILAAIVFLIAGFGLSKLVRPSNPNPEKLSTYECGEEPIGTAWGQFNIKFYIIALIFLVFEVEMIFLFPWSVVFGNKQYIAETNGVWGIFAVIEAFIFVGILAIGLLYAWKKGFLDWVKAEQKIVEFKSPVPKELYEDINKRYGSSKQMKH